MQKISIITVNFNNKNGLLRTINSVLQQTYNNIEYIIIDGGSIDGSAKLISDFQNSGKFSKFTRFYYCSEHDGGIYYGMNKGIHKATGDYLLFLNSGDYLLSSDSIKYLSNLDFYEDIIVFRQKYIDKKGRISNSPRLISEEVNIEFFLTSVFPHQATLIRKSLFDRIGYYKTELKIVADWAFWTEAIIRYHASFKIFDYYLSVMEKGGVSNDINKCQSEMQIVMQQLMDGGLITWKNIFHIASLGRRYQFTQRNKLSRFLSKIAVGLGKRL